MDTKVITVQKLFAIVVVEPFGHKNHWKITSTKVVMNCETNQFKLSK